MEMTANSRLRGISIQLAEFRSRYILPKRGEKAWLKRESSRLRRRQAKEELRSLDLSEWTPGDFEIRPLIPLKRSPTGDLIYVGDD